MVGWGEQMDEKIRQIREDPEAFYARQREEYKRFYLIGGRCSGRTLLASLGKNSHKEKK